MVRIPVVFTPDENFIVQTAIAIMSMLHSKFDDTEYIFFLILEDDFNDTKLNILERIKSVYSMFEYHLVKINAGIFANAAVKTRHITVNSYYRLILADVLSIDKCMYHDGDILVLKDLSEMYHVEMGQHYVAGVKAIVRHQKTIENEALIEKWRFKSFDNYIFGGDLIFNLRKIREDNLTEQFLEQMKRGYPSEDQDVINKCCYGNILFLPLKYCMLNRWVNRDIYSEYENKIYTESEIEEARNKPAIIHYAGVDTKPWSNIRAAYAKVWWRYAKTILTEEEYGIWYKHARNRTEQRDWMYFVRQLKQYQKLILFGFSEISKRLTDSLLKNGYEIICFLDNDLSKQGKAYRGYVVKKLEEIINQKQMYYVIITSQNYRHEIRSQLRMAGIKNKNIIDYYEKSEIYYQALEEKYYGFEFKDICLREFGYIPEDTLDELIKKYAGDTELKNNYYFKYWLDNRKD